MKGFPGGFTVLMAVYGGDAPAPFTRAVQSCFANTLRPDRFTLVVDGTLSWALAASVAAMETQYGLRVIRLAENRGLAAALNEGLSQIDTEWVVRADADDYNLPNRFALQAEAAQVSPSPDLMGGAILEVESDGRPIAIRRTPEDHASIQSYARRRNPFNHMTVAFRTRCARACGGYPCLRLKEDYGLWALMLRDGASTRNLPDVLVHATAGRDMYARRGGGRYAWDEIVLQRHLVRCRLKGPILALFHGACRAAVFLLPAVVRGVVYRRLLRT